jgi:photosystem II stability/assembly factor-like uncharacterized protein
MQPVLGLLLFAGSFSAAAPLPTVASHWTASTLPGGGATALVRDHERLYAANSMGIFISTDEGASWTLPPGAEVPLVSSLAVFPATPQVLLAGTYRGFYRSTDAGYAWRTASADWVSCFPVQLVHTGVTAGTGIYLDAFAFVFHQGGRIFDQCVDDLVSRDGGASWTQGSAPIRSLSEASRFFCDPDDPAVVYLTGLGVLKSVDRGVTWSQTDQGLPPAEDSTFLTTAMAISPSQPATIYLGTSAGLYRSSDAGMNWSLLPGPLATQLGGFAAVDPRTPDHVCALTYPLRVFCSEDGGNDWTDVTSDLPDSQGATGLLFSETGCALYLAGNFGVVRQDFPRRRCSPLPVAQPPIAPVSAR